MAFDLGFRDVDRISGRSTPLYMKIEEVAFPIPDTDYCRWLIAHGGDYTRNWTWPIKDSILTPGAVASPNYSILHRIFRSQSGFINSSALDHWVSVLVRSPWFSHFAKSTAFYDRCSCACLASPEGCSPFAIYRNCLIELNAGGSRRNGSLRDAVNTINDYAGVIESSSDLAESTIRSLTFHRLKIRHTCCASIGRSNSLPHDYGSDFDELREEDEYRVRQLNELVKSFMDQYNESALSLKDFVDGPWVEQMDRIAVKEKNTEWTAQEKNKLLTIGVVPKDDPVDDDKSSQCSSAFETDYKDKDEAVALRYWNRQFEIIANGGRSEVESREWLKWQFRRASTKERSTL
ncbi:hypothetical protein GGS24DRAFT_30660 [Hypoxylon argillaceum]|nr:hypothetical protein GGS24DRAFT_30660 [Hypoxylon argillaceum]